MPFREDSVPRPPPPAETTPAETETDARRATKTAVSVRRRPTAPTATTTIRREQGWFLRRQSTPPDGSPDSSDPPPRDGDCDDDGAAPESERRPVPAPAELCTEDSLRSWMIQHDPPKLLANRPASDPWNRGASHVAQLELTLAWQSLELATLRSQIDFDRNERAMLEQKNSRLAYELAALKEELNRAKKENADLRSGGNSRGAAKANILGGVRKLFGGAGNPPHERRRCCDVPPGDGSMRGAWTSSRPRSNHSLSTAASSLGRDSDFGGSDRSIVSTEFGGPIAPTDRDLSAKPTPSVNGSGRNPFKKTMHAGDGSGRNLFRTLFSLKRRSGTKDDKRIDRRLMETEEKPLVNAPTSEDEKPLTTNVENDQSLVTVPKVERPEEPNGEKSDNRGQAPPLIKLRRGSNIIAGALDLGSRWSQAQPLRADETIKVSADDDPAASDGSRNPRGSAKFGGSGAETPEGEGQAELLSSRDKPDVDEFEVKDYRPGKNESDEVKVASICGNASVAKKDDSAPGPLNMPRWMSSALWLFRAANDGDGDDAENKCL